MCDGGAHHPSTSTYGVSAGAVSPKVATGPHTGAGFFIIDKHGWLAGAGADNICKVLAAAAAEPSRHGKQHLESCSRKLAFPPRTLSRLRLPFACARMITYMYCTLRRSARRTVTRRFPW